MYIIIIYTSLLMLFTMSVQASDSVQTTAQPTEYYRWFGGFMFGITTGEGNFGAENRIIRKGNFYVGVRLNKDFGITADIFDGGPVIQETKENTAISYWRFLLNADYYIVPEENISVAMGLGIGSNMVASMSGGKPPIYDNEIKRVLKLSAAYVPKFLGEYVRIETGYIRNLQITVRPNGGDVRSEFAFLTIGFRL